MIAAVDVAYAFERVLRPFAGDEVRFANLVAFALQFQQHPAVVELVDEAPGPRLMPHAGMKRGDLHYGTSLTR